MASGKKSKTSVADIVFLFITKRGVTLFGTIPVLIGGLGMVGWIPGTQFLDSIRSDFIPMAPSTAVSFQLASTNHIWRTEDFCISPLC